MLVSDLTGLFLLHARAIGLYSPKTMSCRQQTFADFNAAWPGLELEDARAWHLEDWIEAHPWKTGTKRAKARALQAVVNWAVRQDRVSRNPFLGVSYAEGEPRQPMSDTDLAKLCHAASKPVEAALRFLRLTGCRTGELARMTWQDIDWKRGLVVLADHKTRKKTGRARVIVLAPEVSVLLAGVATALQQPSGAIFLNSRGRPWHPDDLGQNIRRLRKRLGLGPLVAHQIRHQFAYAALRSGANLSLVSKALGHANIGITDRVYGHLAEDWEAIRSAAVAAGPVSG